MWLSSHNQGKFDVTFFIFFLRQTEGVPVQVPESEDEGTGTALGLGIVTETEEEVAHALRTGGVQGKQWV